jgi:hypothetical protein
VTGGAIDLSGIETVNITGTDGVADTYQLLNYGAASDIRTVNVSGGDTNNNDNDTIDITTTAGLDTINLRRRFSANTASLTGVQGPTINVLAFNNADNNLSLNGAGGLDTLNFISGRHRRPDGHPGRGRHADHAHQARQAASGCDRLHRHRGRRDRGRRGDDRLDVDNSNGLVAIVNGITFHGSPAATRCG